ncbi:gamma-glutamyl-gamma-aminobutyrate hydrolase family protein [Pseudomonas xionganensis]|uniref:gamma-glutamyl-gamma-aminobutyrate hydrolase n=1 Tax=Pseudomonas xionganensis TaxID=2654845 RepID=A0A6I4KVQ3_9PSED|nr:gamma-glutamyl-gamma-aminobutyrate hydrolase family protein [Pseudomonas xionganensis]MVW73863.1 gamma-glutamyl-gamma-aminobutyrate hydrolase family protein [Pseudomonas xionganensis]
MSNHNANTFTAKRKPVVLMSMGAQERKGHAYQVMTHKYITPLAEISGCVPLLAPSCCGVDDLEQYLSMVDGVYLTGAGSNIDPILYGQDNLTPNKGQDKDRDLFDIPLIRAAIERGIPLFGICRGMQEINVALGGDIHQKAYEVPGFNDHREDSNDPVEVQYSDTHKVRPVPGSWLAELIGEEEFPVNSLHGQAIDRLGEGLEPLAHAEDGLIEAIHMPGAKQFTAAVQWHPEWRATENPYSVKLFQAFGEACRQYAAQRDQ